MSSPCDSGERGALQAFGVHREVTQRGVLFARGVFDAAGHGETALRAAALGALSAAELPDHTADALHCLRDLTAAARLFLGGALDLLRDGAHFFATFHDEL